ncbi:MAG: tRNA threonylcarbamoyladenosine dehydratase [Spirochaetes bacterium]|nr:tRNA threonylcarbamoyladenosine dehydratase [Spirochaetota bacterium]
MNSFYENMTHRTLMVIGQKALDRLGTASVIIFGVGGVGSWCAESLVRSGLLNLTMVDSDIVCPTNINRQAQALARNVGESKVEEMKKRLLEINPSAAITARHGAYDEKSCDSFDLKSFDYVIDAIDSIKNKVLLIEQCLEKGVTIYSSMGAGAKSDPSKIRIDLLSRTKNCPLARTVRRRLRQDSASTDIPCVYSEELPVQPAAETVCGSGDCPCARDRAKFCADHDEAPIDWCGMKKQINGALAHVTGTFGFMLAGMIINDIMARAAADAE